MTSHSIFHFVQQEPGENGTEILNSLKFVRPGGGFEPNFELTERIDVNGPNEHPLYTFLKVGLGYIAITLLEYFISATNTCCLLLNKCSL